MRQSDIDKLLGFCPVCGGEMQNLTLRWGKTCPKDGDLYVKEAVETTTLTTLEIRMVLPTVPTTI